MGDLLGQTLGGTYQLVRRIGEGGMGAVYEAVNPRLTNKRYAVKMLHGMVAQNEEVYARFRREAEITSQLGNDHIVEVHDFNTTPGGQPYMVMEFMEGEDLAERIASRGRMNRAQVMSVLKGVCSGLSAAHQAGIVHRDLKPQNIFLCNRFGRDDFAKILDFGVSKVRDSDSVLTQDNTLMGTPNYMSPEQAEGQVSAIDHRTDIFALGAIVWEMLVGKLCFEAPTLAGVVYQVVHGQPKPVHELVVEHPASITAVLNIAMAKDKESRYGWVDQFLTDLEAAFGGVMPASPGGVPEAVAQTVTGRAVSGTAATVDGVPTPVPGSAPVVPAAATPAGQPTTTLSAAAGQQAMEVAEAEKPAASPTRKSKLPMAAALLLVVAIAGYGITEFMGASQEVPEPSQAAVAAPPEVVPAAVEAAPPDTTPGRAPPDAGAAKVVVVAPPKPPKASPAGQGEGSGSGSAVDEKAPQPKAGQLVSIRFDVSPARARSNFVAEIGRFRGSTLQVRRGKEEILVVIHARGYKPERVSVRPTKNQTIKVTLEPQRRTKRRPQRKRNNNSGIFD